MGNPPLRDESLSNSEAAGFNPQDRASQRRIRVLIAKPGLDGHDRGALVVARALREAGMEVVYTGIRQTPAAVAEAAKKHAADVVGLSILSGAHLTLFPRVLDALEKQGVDLSSVLLLAGGIIPDEDLPALKEMGFAAIFGPGTDTRQVVTFIRKALEGDSLSQNRDTGGPTAS